MKTFFTSDTHFGHANIIRYCNRPFVNVRDMDESMIENWNAVVGKDDRVYHLGDFGFFREPDQMRSIVERLSGHIALILGNHDRRILDLLRRAGLEPRFSVMPDKIINLDVLTETEPDDFLVQRPLVLSHYPQACWEDEEMGAFMLHGHTHGTISPIPGRWDVGVDCWNFTPVTFDEILKRQFDTFGMNPYERLK